MSDIAAYITMAKAIIKIIKAYKQAVQAAQALEKGITPRSQALASAHRLFCKEVCREVRE